jgi:DNA-binding LacI/PurR family transcriptional regulator
MENKTDKLLRKLREKVTLGGYSQNAPLPAEQDLCAEYQVSRVTVRRVLHAMIEQGIVYRRGGSHGRLFPMRPAEQETASGPRHDAGVLIYDSEMINHPYMHRFLAGVMRVFDQTKTNYRILSLTSRDHDEREIDFLLHRIKENALNGLIINCRLPDEALRALEDMAFPTVLFKSQIPGLNLPYVMVGEDAGVTVFKHLQKMGRKRIAYITGPSHDRSVNESIFLIRQHCYYSGSVFYPELVLESAYQIERIPALVQKLVKEHADAIVVDDDFLAAAAIAECRKLGLRVPEDIAVGGTNDMPFNRSVSPKLTSAFQPVTEAGECAARILSRLLRGESVEKTGHQFPCSLEIKESCGAGLKAKSADSSGMPKTALAAAALAADA